MSSRLPLSGLYVASYVGDETGLLTLFAVDKPTGALKVVWEHRETFGLRALTNHPARGVLYGVGGSDRGTVVAVDVSTGHAQVLSRTSSGGITPCSVAVDRAGLHLLTVNYDSGELIVFRLERDGSIAGVSAVLRQTGAGPDSDRQEASHPHQVLFTPDGGRVVVVDLGADALYVYDLEAGNLRLSSAGPSNTPPGAGPRHLAFLAEDLAAVADELSGSVSLYRFARRSGAFTWQASIPASALERAGVRNYPGDIAAAAGGRALVSNRGNDTIGLFRIRDGGLEHIAEISAGASWPQHLAVIDERVYCAGYGSGEVTVAELPAATTTQFTAAQTVAEVATPTWLLVGQVHGSGRSS